MELKALETQINEFGQTPRQLFATPHPRRSVIPPPPDPATVFTSLTGGVAASGGPPTVGVAVSAPQPASSSSSSAASGWAVCGSETGYRALALALLSVIRQAADMPGLEQHVALSHADVTQNPSTTVPTTAATETAAPPVVQGEGVSTTVRAILRTPSPRNFAKVFHRSASEGGASVGGASGDGYKAGASPAGSTPAAAAAAAAATLHRVSSAAGGMLAGLLKLGRYQPADAATATTTDTATTTTTTTTNLPTPALPPTHPALSSPVVQGVLPQRGATPNCNQSGANAPTMQQQQQPTDSYASCVEVVDAAGRLGARVGEQKRSYVGAHGGNMPDPTPNIVRPGPHGGADVRGGSECDFASEEGELLLDDLASILRDGDATGFTTISQEGLRYEHAPATATAIAADTTATTATAGRALVCTSYGNYPGSSSPHGVVAHRGMEQAPTITQKQQDRSGTVGLGAATGAAMLCRSSGWARGVSVMLADAATDAGSSMHTIAAECVSRDAAVTGVATWRCQGRWRRLFCGTSSHTASHCSSPTAQRSLVATS